MVKKLTDKDIKEIMKLRWEGKTYKYIMEKFNIHLSTIQYHTNEKYKERTKARMRRNMAQKNENVRKQ